MKQDSLISSKAIKKNNTLFRPCIDLHQGHVKQIIGETLSSNQEKFTNNRIRENFISQFSSEYYANLYKRDKLKGGHVIMLGPNNEEQAKLALHTYPYGLQIGGGITNQNAAYWLEQQASHIIITSYVFYNGECDFERLKKISNLVSKDKLVLDLSCRWLDGDYYVMTDKWQKKTNVKIDRDTLEKFSEYCSEFLIHAIEVEGKQRGIDRRLIEILVTDSPITCVYAGGISSLTDIEYIENTNCQHLAYTIGSGLDLFGGKNLNYRNVVNRYTKQK